MSSLEAERCQNIEEVVASRDMISSLPDDLLIQILLFVSTKDAAATMILSKRWRYIWTLVPKLEYKDTGGECESVLKCLDKLLELHKAPVLETLYIQLGKKCPIEVDFEKLIANAVDRFVCKLVFELYSTAVPTSLPKSLYTCKTLVELTLSHKIVVDVPSSACLPSLKILHLFFVVFKDEDSLEKLVSSCSVLARSLVCLFITEKLRSRFPMVHKHYNCSLKRPHINVVCNIDDKILRAISLVRSFTINLEDPMALSGITFSRLELLMIYPLGHLWLDLLLLILNNSPKLRHLAITNSVKRYGPGNLPLSWNQPILVPGCLSSHLDELTWNGYRGSEVEKQLMSFLLANSKCLKKVTIALTSTSSLTENEMTKKELKSMSRVSTSELLFE